jgi:hypothetical protein
MTPTRQRQQMKNPMIMLILLVPGVLLGLVLGMDRLERWAVQPQDEQA